MRFLRRAYSNIDYQRRNISRGRLLILSNNCYIRINDESIRDKSNVILLLNNKL